MLSGTIQLDRAHDSCTCLLVTEKEDAELEGKYRRKNTFSVLENTHILDLVKRAKLLNI